MKIDTMTLPSTRVPAALQDPFNAIAQAMVNFLFDPSQTLQEARA